MVQRKTVKEGAIIGGAFVVLLAAMAPLIRAADTAWEQEGILYTVVAAFAGPFGGNLDFPVVFVVGILVGWFLLFVLDGTKRLQALFILVAAGLVLVPALQRLDRVISSVARQPEVFVVGVVVGLVVGISFGRLYGVKQPANIGITGLLKWSQFPAANGGQFYTVTALVVLTAVQYPFVTDAGLADVVVVFSAAVASVFALTVFVSYDYQNRVVTVAPNPDDGKFDPYVIGGLYRHAKTARHGFPIEGDAELVDAENAMGLDMLAPRFHDPPVSFGYLNEGIMTRTAIIEAEGWRMNDINQQQIRRRLQEQSTGRNTLGTLWRALRYYCWCLVPSPIQSMVEYTGGTVLNRLDHADTVVLLAPTPENGDPDIKTQPYLDLCTLYENDVQTDIVVATTEARPVADSIEEGITLNGYFRLEVGERLGIPETKVQSGACEVVPVDRFSGDEAEGFDVLLDNISN